MQESLYLQKMLRVFLASIFGHVTYTKKKNEKKSLYIITSGLYVLTGRGFSVTEQYGADLILADIIISAVFRRDG